MIKNYYYTVKAEGEGLFKEKGSKFISFAYSVDSVSDVNEQLEILRKRFHDARHHCYAYIIGQGATNTLQRANDDGEPNHSAGDPILGQIKSFELTNTLVVVIRYFGGTKLGVAGLINAYKTAAAEALKSSGLKQVYLREWFQIRFPYESTNEIMRLVNSFEVEIKDQVYEQDCRFNVGILVDQTEKFLADSELLKKTGVDHRASKLDE